MQKFKKFMAKHTEIFTIFGLSMIFYFIFFHNNWAYALMDVDESRYVTMARDMFHTKDYLTLYLNNAYFFEKPPLFFWSECLSFGLFGKITEATARFPAALYATLACFMTYFTGKKIVSGTFGLVSSLMLATSFEYVILGKFAILDIVLASLVWCSLCFGMLTQFCKESNKKYFWWLFYAFSGLAVMAKGIPGVAIPFGSMFFITLYSKTFKEAFKPKYFLVGMFIFLAIVLPWHIIMLKMHGQLFFDEYIIKHHISRFVGSAIIRRQQPFYFYLITIAWGFLPWIISVLTVLIRKITKKDLKFTDLNDYKRFILYNGIIFLFTLIFFSASKTKLITYILPLYPALACLGGYLWTNYIERGEYSRVINKTVYAIGGIFILSSVLALFTQYYLPNDINTCIEDAKPLCIVLLFTFGLSSMICAKKAKYVGVFFSYVIFIACLSAFGTEKLFEVDYKFGQDDLIKYAQYANEHNKSITCYNFNQKYSLLFYSNQPVNYGVEYDINDLKRELNKPNNLVIIERKTIKNLNNIKFNVIYKGKKYWLTEK